MTRYDSFVLRSGGGKKILVAWHACKEEEEASRKFSRNIFVSSLTHNHICSSLSYYTSQLLQIIVKVVQHFRASISPPPLQKRSWSFKSWGETEQHVDFVKNLPKTSCKANGSSASYYFKNCIESQMMPLHIWYF